jgi:branched-chain amino acid transport system substrate-binding protein
VTSTITAGAALSLSGRFAVQGEQARRGLVLWAEHVNNQGGLALGPGAARRPVELRVYDDGSKIAGATAGTERLIVQDRVNLLFGPYGSVLAIAAAEVAERHGRVLWNHGGSSDALEQRGWQRVVTLLSPASRYFVPVLDMAVRHARMAGRPIRTVALLHGASGTFPQAVIAGARAHAARLGLDIVLDEPYPPASPAPPVAPTPQPPAPCVGGGGLPQLVSRLRSLAPGLVLGVGTTEADLAFARALRARRVPTTTIALVAAPIELFREALGPDADGFCGPSQWEPTLHGQLDLGPTSGQFCDDFRRRFGLAPDYPAAQAYAAGLIAAHCVEIAGSFDDDALRLAAGSLDLTTFYGRFRLDPRTGQQAGHAMVVAQWQAGQKQIVWPPAAATAPLQLPVPTAISTVRPPDEAPFS